MKTWMSRGSAKLARLACCATLSGAVGMVACGEQAQTPPPRVETAGGALTGLGQCQGPDQWVDLQLGPAQGYNVFAHEYLRGVRDIEGKVAARAACFRSSVGVGSRLADPASMEALRVVDVDATCETGLFPEGASGQFFGGVLATEDLWAGWPEQVNVLGERTVWARKAGDQYFDRSRHELLDLSDELGSAPASGGTSVADVDGTLVLAVVDGDHDADDADLFVFDLPADAFQAGRSLRVKVAPTGEAGTNGGWVLVNVRGEAVAATDLELNVEGIADDHVLYNFPTATDVSFVRARIHGSFLAPRADVLLDNAEMLGSVVAKGLDGGDGNGQPREFPFAGGAVHCPDMPCDGLAPGVEREYEVHAITEGLLPQLFHNVWAQAFNCGKRATTVQFDFLEDGRFRVYPGGLATLTGTVVVVELAGGIGTLGEAWALSASFQYRGTGPDGQGSGGPKLGLPSELDVQPYAITEGWEYYDFVEGTMQRVGAPEDRVSLSLRAEPDNFPLQVGYTANNETVAFGASMWFDFLRGGAECVSTGPGAFFLDLERVWCNAPETPGVQPE